MWYVLKRVMNKKYILYFALLFLIIIGQVICEILLPLTLVQLTNQAGYAGLFADFQSTALKNVGIIAGFMILFCALFILFGASAGLLSSWLGTKICGDIRLKLYRKIQDLSFADIEKFKTSSLITRLTTDIEAVQNSLFMIFRLGLRSFLLFIGGFIGTIIISSLPNLKILPWLEVPSQLPTETTPGGLWWLVPVILLIISLIMFVSIMKILTSSSKQYKLTKYAIDDTNSVMRENILGVRVVKSFNLQENQIKRFRTANENLRKISEKSFIISMWMFPIINLLMGWAVIITIWVGAYTKAVDVSKIGTIMSITTLILFGMVLLINVIMQVSIAVGSCARVAEVFDTESSIVFKEDGLNIEKPVIKFDNVSFKYSETGDYVLKDINLQIKEDETIGIIGATGSGKSTFVSLITRMYDATEGKVLVSNIDIKDINRHSLRHEIALSPQNVTLFSGTIASNLRFGKEDATLKDMEAAAKGAQAYDFIMDKKDKFETKVEQRGMNFSGGQKQRISIARALIGNPKILILDSSTSALDMITEKNVNEYIKETNKGRTTIIISQRISGVKSADRILVFDKGKIVGDGSHIELLRNNAIYRDIATSQLGQEGVESELQK